MTGLPAAFLKLPLAHRALHDAAAGRIENSVAAIRAAVDAGYGIEVDVQATADDRAIVFHDYGLERLTARTGPTRSLTAAQAGETPLSGSDETIPTLRDCLTLIAGRVPLLIEIKDEDRSLGPNVGALERAVADDLADYRGPVAVMSFNPHSVAAMKHFAPDVPRGLVTCAWDGEHGQRLSAARRESLLGMRKFGETGSVFVSHDVDDLDSPELAKRKSEGVPILTWTIRSEEAERRARRVADNITFEGYLPRLPA